MEKIERILVSLDQALSTMKKRHIAGGVLMSVSLLFGGLVLTVMTLKEKEKKKMKNQLSNIIIFAAGAAIGSAITWKLLKTKYEQIAQEEIDSVKAAFSRREESDDSEEEEDEEYEPTEEDVTSYHKLVDANGYVNYSDKKEEKGEQEEMDKKTVRIISPDDFSENDDYEAMTYYCYQDNVLEDTEGNVIDDIGGMTGSELLDHFGEYEDDSVFLRDDENQRDIEVLLDDRRYSEVYPQQ